MYKKKDIHFLIENYAKNPFNCQQDFINCGIARNVYRLDETHVIKISQNTLNRHINHGTRTDGVAQTMREIAVYKNVPFEYKYLFNPIVDKGIYAGYTYIVQEYVDVAGDRVESTTYEEVCKTLNYNQEEIDRRVEDIEKVCELFDLERGDILDYSANLGVRQDNAQLVVIDYGFPIVG